MKKILIVVALIAFVFTLTACDETKDLVCSETEEIIDGSCVPITPTCDLNEELVDSNCVCSDGFELVEEICTVIDLSNMVLVPDFYGETYGTALIWSFDNGIQLVPSSDFTDDVEPNTVYFQDIAAGDSIKKGSSLVIKYSSGYDPNGIIEVPDFSGMTEDDVKVWLAEHNIGKYSFLTSIDDSAEGTYINYEVLKLDEHEYNLRRDKYEFFFSFGPVEIEEIDFFDPSTVRGVNLGGWFVLEGWMTPNLFSGIDAHDETEFMQKEGALEKITEHWDTFITEDDFMWLAEKEVEYIRLPIPWWYQGDTAYVGTEHEVTYGDSRVYIHQAMQWAEDYGINVLLDLHTAPWSQNGFDNGGMDGVFKWHTDPANIDLTVEKIGDITTDFSGYDSLWGIEVLNEPAWAVPYDVLTDYYERSYIAIRNINQDVWVGFHDGFRGYDFGTWATFFIDNDFDNVFFDTHLYHVFGDMWGSFDINDHLRWIEIEQSKAIHRYDTVGVPTIVGEWSLGLQGHEYQGLSNESIRDLKMAFGNAQLNMFEESMGWFFWNYKIDADSHTEWDFRRLVDQGYFPDDFTVTE